MNILISGIAGDIGFGVGRVLRDWGWVGSLYGIDIHSQHPGTFVVDRHDVAPSARHPMYLSWLAAHVESYDIGLFIPTSEAEIAVLTEHRIRQVAGASVLMANELAVTRSLDKHTCLTFLDQRGISVPENGIVGATAPSAYPVIVKPRSGQGSKNVRRVETAEDFDKLGQLGQVWQEYLPPDNQEYTCPVYSSEAIGVRTLVIRRTLAGGVTGYGEVVNDPLITEYVDEIVKHLQVEGAINVQLRLTDKGPRLFEINPRLSSTLVFRDKLGFSDLRWWIQDAVGADLTPPLAPYRRPSAGTQFFRGAQEYIVANRPKNC